MSTKSTVPDAWDDDWEAQADDATNISEVSRTATPVSKAERKAQHERDNKKLWESAESTEKFHFLETRGDVPLKTEFKPSIKVLSRKPTPKVDPANGMSQLALEDDDDDEEEARKKKALSPGEQRLKAEREREEKRKKYEEARERLFGSQSTGSGSSTPSMLTPPPVTSVGRGKNRGKDNREGSASRPKKSSAEVPTEQSTEGRRLYDPNYHAKLDSSYIQRRNAEAAGSGRSTPSEEQQPVRQPRGPDGSGRGGSGFTARGARVP
ncbi:MAG: hypothetical protein M1812_007141 [Candelaria pacifica]|nr:MAG: hypothetical protein M1812_007141 [Candelaria pacifica]